MEKRINCLEGIRAIACLGIFFCHFRGSFLPGFSLPFWDNSPLRILTAGNPVVRILFVLSGFVISYKYFLKEEYESISFDIVKRWFRLAPSVFFAVFFSYLLMKLDLYYNVEAATIAHSENFLALFNNFEPSLLLCLREGIYACFLNGANAYVGPLWTMTYEYLGSILVLAVLMIFKKSKVRYAFYFIQLVFFSSYYNYFILGMLVCDIYISGVLDKMFKKHNYIYCILFITSFCFLAMLNIDDTNKIVRVEFAILLVIMFLSLLKWKHSEKWLGNRFMQWLGKNSFSVYLVHWPIIESFSSWYFLRMMNDGVSYKWVVLSCFVFSLIIILIIAHLFTKYIENMGKGAILYIKKYCFEKDGVNGEASYE